MSGALEAFGASLDAFVGSASSAAELAEFFDPASEVLVELLEASGDSQLLAELILGTGVQTTEAAFTSLMTGLVADGSPSDALVELNRTITERLLLDALEQSITSTRTDAPDSDEIREVFDLVWVQTQQTVDDLVAELISLGKDQAWVLSGRFATQSSADKWFAGASKVVLAVLAAPIVKAYTIAGVVVNVVVAPQYMGIATEAKGEMIVSYPDRLGRATRQLFAPSSGAMQLQAAQTPLRVQRDSAASTAEAEDNPFDLRHQTNLLVDGNVDIVFEMEDGRVFAAETSRLQGDGRALFLLNDASYASLSGALPARIIISEIDDVGIAFSWWNPRIRTAATLVLESSVTTELTLEVEPDGSLAVPDIDGLSVTVFEPDEEDDGSPPGAGGGAGDSGADEGDDASDAEVDDADADASDEPADSQDEQTDPPDQPSEDGTPEDSEVLGEMTETDEAV